MGADHPGQINQINEQNKEWRELRFHPINSAESERELEKLSVFGVNKKAKEEDEDMKEKKSV